MTASPRDHLAPSVDDSAHFAALPASPLAAYALGMLRMLQRTSSAVDRAASAHEPTPESEAMASQVLAFLSDVNVPLSEKHALVETIERANDIAVVTRVLHLHAIADIGSPKSQRDASINNGDETLDEQNDTDASTHDASREHITIPEALGCAICCDELMLKPVSLLCGHSFCKRCVDLWLKSCANCPTCRQPVGASAAAVGVNLALHEVMVGMFPDKLKALEDHEEMERLDSLRTLIAQSIESGRSIRELIAHQRDNELHATQADVSHVLESDPALQQQVMAAEIRERLRKEKALREESRRRHMVAYCGALPAGARMMHTVVAPPPPAPTVSVQSNRPVKKYVPPPKKSAFFGSLLRR